MDKKDKKIKVLNEKIRRSRKRILKIKGLQQKQNKLLDQIKKNNNEKK